MNESPSYIIKQYYHKSFNLLYPLLGFKQNEACVPTNTYLYWNGEENIDACELIVFYSDITDHYEKHKILPHTDLKSCYLVDDGFVYIFSLINFYDDVLLFKEGRYSEFSKTSKFIIRNYHKDLYEGKPIPGHPFHMIFNPHLYKELVLEELGLPESELAGMKELWDKPDIKQETAYFNIETDCECKTFYL